jgi:hypothetical protein
MNITIGKKAVTKSRAEALMELQIVVASAFPIHTVLETEQGVSRSQPMSAHLHHLEQKNQRNAAQEKNWYTVAQLVCA